MGPQFSRYELQQMTPLLGNMAQMVSRGSQLGESEIKSLLGNTSMANNSIVLNELKLWGRLLKYLHEQPLPELRAATIATLVSRHLPEAEVLLAVDIVLSDSAAKPVVAPRFAEVEPHKSDPPGVIDAVLAASMVPKPPQPQAQTPVPEGDLARMIEEAMGLSPAPGNVPGGNKQTDKAQQKQGTDANTEILRQLHDLFG